MAASPDFIGDQEACIRHLRREIPMLRKMDSIDIIRIYFAYHEVGAGRNVYVYITGAASPEGAPDRWTVYIKR